MSLTWKQELFCQKYIELEGNASEAYRKSYNCEESKPETITNNAYMLTQNSDVAARIEELQELALKRHQVTVDRTVAEYGKLAFLDIGKAFFPDGTLRPLNEMDADTRAAISGFEVVELNTQEENISSQVKKIKFVDKKGALDSLAKFLGIFVDKVEHSGTMTLGQLVLDSYKTEEKKGE